MIRKLISRITGIAARCPLPRFLRGKVYGTYAQRYSTKLEEAELPIEDYGSFQSFFTRKLKAGARPIDSDPLAVTSPADCKISAMGEIRDESIFQAKGIDYTLSELLGSDTPANGYRGGNFLTLYLAPGDCHRVYLPTDSIIENTKHIPGTLFSVRDNYVQKVPRLFCRNERVLFHLKTDHGPACLIMVGALNVGSIQRTAPLQQKISKGNELAIFQLGSTVILLFPKNAVKLENFPPASTLKIGQRIGHWIS